MNETEQMLGLATGDLVALNSKSSGPQLWYKRQ